MIQRFRDKDTEQLFLGHSSRKLPQDLQRLARRKLLQIDTATKLETLRVPPGNRLETLKGNRKGQHSIRINDSAGQGRPGAASARMCRSGLRICFTWRNGHAYDVEIVDYH